MERKMKNSGIPWIGMIPSDWEVCFTKQLMRNKSIKGFPDEQVLSLYRDYGVVPKDSRDDNHNVTSEDTATYKLVEVGDFVINKMKAWQGSMAISAYRGIISPAYYICRFTNESVNRRYIHYLLRNETYKTEYRRLSTGLRVGQWDLNIDDFLHIPAILPPLPTQQRIADFLDCKCAEIDELAALQETMIAELKRYKQSVITEAVSKGLDPDVPMKDSGVEWIGEIPEGWEVKKVKNVTTAINKGNGITKEEVFADGDTPCVRYGEIYSKYDNSFVTCISKTKKDVLSTLHYFGNGDILCAGTGELVEEIGKSIVYLGDNKCLAGGDIIVLSHNQNPLFLNFALNSRYAQAQKSCSKAKLKVVHISAYDIGSVLIAFPPLSEQRAIADYLDRKCAEIDELIAIKQQKIEALKEYKKSVIFEYVTGKKEVEL
jgi:type I restriction enzyme S subunit